jgi:hypothetical protein
MLDEKQNSPGTDLANRPDRPAADAEWLNSHGQQLLELIRGFGFHVPTTLRTLITVATGQPVSDPPRWCETGCARADEAGNCTIPAESAKYAGTGTPEERHWDGMLARMVVWDNAHIWELGQPRDGILFDCPLFQGRD